MMLRDKAMGWWQQRAPRERNVLAAGAALLLITIVYLLIEPVIQQRARIQAELPRLREDLAWMQQQGATIEQLRGSNGMVNTGRSGLTISLVEELLREAGVHAQVSDLRPGPGQSVVLRFNQVAYTQLMELLLQLRVRAAARVSLASITRLQDQPGMVEASLTLGPETLQ